MPSELIAFGRLILQLGPVFVFKLFIHTANYYSRIQRSKVGSRNFLSWINHFMPSFNILSNLAFESARFIYPCVAPWEKGFTVISYSIYTIVLKICTSKGHSQQAITKRFKKADVYVFLLDFFGTKLRHKYLFFFILVMFQRHIQWYE